ncbi:MAG: 5-(carboxyamino)imidazole ribonucleotide mutase [Deltaproteobacteria bacterium]|jgi:5-(carboxyamino)imidazole ribonucleotide mutase|nr:5-(carboxyamino)imidazole ribonucleotide mutase [Deltaproteobacteria bacterium]
MAGKPLVGVVLGSASDLPLMGGAAEVLDSFRIPHETIISSAHRHPERTIAYAKAASGRGLKVLIAGAGMAAHLAGVLASSTILPVIGVPLASGSSHAANGLDALLSTVQMPTGVPVATVAIGGAKNAAYLALAMLALGDPGLSEKLEAFREVLRLEVEEKSRELFPGT